MGKSYPSNHVLRDLGSSEIGCNNILVIVPYKYHLKVTGGL